VDDINGLADAKTKLVLVNSPHTPTGFTISDSELDNLHEFTSARGIQLVSDEVYHPIYHGRPTKSAARLPHATVIHDFSKAFPLSGLRIGWMIEHDQKYREQYWNARTIFSISNNTTGEILAEIATRNRDIVLGKTQETANTNLRRLNGFMAEHSETLGWIPPRGGTTAFPWLLSGEDARPFCQAAAERGILLVPGDCYDMPSHFRLGFAAAAPDAFSSALSRLGELVQSWSARMAPA
jgi:aspartate/methionine/tyrosine aminotransferase